MDAYQTYSIINTYKELEERLNEFLWYVPFTLKNLDVDSPRLAGIVTEACNLLDSLFREVTSQTVTIDGRTKQRKQLNIVDFAKLYASRLNLPNTRTLIFVSPPLLLNPYAAWSSIASGGTYTATTWWAAYTDLKHSRIRYIEKATLSNAVNALCGLHQAIAKLSEFGFASELGKALLRYDWLKAGGYNPEIIIETFEGKRGVGFHDTLMIESTLFALPIGRYPFPGDIQNIMPAIYGSKRLISFLGRLI